REAPLVVVVVTADDQVDAVAVEERKPLLTQPAVGAVPGPRRAERILVHLDDDPVDAFVLAGLSQRVLQPASLRAAAVAADVERGPGLDDRIARDRGGMERARSADEGAAVLVDDVVRGQRDEEHRADAEAVPAAGEGRAVARQRVPAEVRGEALRPVL